MGEPNVPEGSIVITPAQMYESTNQSIGRIQTDLADLKGSLSPLPTQVADHETRIRRLERGFWIAVGFSAAAGSAAGSVAAKLFA